MDHAAPGHCARPCRCQQKNNETDGESDQTRAGKGQVKGDTAEGKQRHEEQPVRGAAYRHEICQGERQEVFEVICGMSGVSEDARAALGVVRGMYYLVPSLTLVIFHRRLGTLVI